jgi:hypothetical protein
MLRQPHGSRFRLRLILPAAPFTPHLESGIDAEFRLPLPHGATAVTAPAKWLPSALVDLKLVLFGEPVFFSAGGLIAFSEPDFHLNGAGLYEVKI